MKILFTLLLALSLTGIHAQTTASKTHSSQPAHISTHSSLKPQSTTTRTSYNNSKPARPEHTASYTQPDPRTYRPAGHTSPVTKTAAENTGRVYEVNYNGEPANDEYDNFAYPEKGCMLISIEELRDPNSNRRHILAQMPERFCLFTNGGRTVGYLWLQYHLITVTMFPMGYGEYPKHIFPANGE